MVDVMPQDDRDTTAVSTLLLAALVALLGTTVTAPSRLPLLAVPLSFLVAAHGMGLLLERAAGARCPPVSPSLPVLALTVRLATGLSLLGLSATVLGLLGLYHFTALPILVALAWSLVDLVRHVPPLRFFRPTAASLAGGLGIGILWCIAWLWATIPPTFYDELAYHLPIAQYALRTGTIPALPWSFFTYMPHLSDLLLGWGLALAGDTGARAMHFLFWLASWIAGWAVVEAVAAPERRAWTGFALAGAFASCATFFFLGTLPFAETSLTFAVLASVALIASPGASAFWLPLGLLWGLTLSVKLSGFSWMIAGALAALVMGWPVRSLAGAGLVTLLTSLPWWGRAWWLTGNPVYPLGYRWLGGLDWNDVNQARLQGDLPVLGEPVTLPTLLRLPYDMVMAPERFGSASECGPLAVGAVCLTLSLPLWALVKQPDHATARRCYAAGLFVLITTAAWLMTSTTTRFFSPALMLGLSTLVALLIHAPKAVLAVAMVVLTALGAWGSARFLSIHALAFSSEQVALGRESAPDYAARTVDHYDAARYVNEHLPPTANLLFIGESRPFYFDRPSLAPYPFHDHPLTQWVREAASSEQLRDRLRREGFTHVVLNTREFKRLHDTYHILEFTGPDAALLDQRLKQLPRTMTTLFSKNGVYVFEIPAPS